MSTKRIIVGITGASGIAFGIRLLQMLKDLNVETHLVVSKAGDLTRAFETAFSAAELRGLAFKHYAQNDLAAPISSGSFRTSGMVIIPCSARTLGEIASGASSTLLTRAADVALKERRKLVLVVRETPLSLIHLKNMCAVTEAGGVIMPPMPAFYNLPATLDDMVNDTVARVLDQFEIEVPGLKRWGEAPARPLETPSNET